jgi:isoquinoline 1-oxidoreductase beta subunit
VNTTIPVNRRDFIKIVSAAGTGLLLGVHLPSLARVFAETAPNSGEPFAPNAWIRITPDNVVTILVDKSEMGQGVETSLPMLVAEELEVDLAKIHTEFAPAGPVYQNPMMGQQGTGGSSSVHTGFDPLRRAGAAAREMLIAAAAQRWGIDPQSCRARDGFVIDERTDKKLSYGELAGAAAKMPVPKNVTLKEPKDWKLLGKPAHRVDTPLKVDGSAVFGIDVKVPNALVAVVARCPVFGGKVKSFDATAAKKIGGVKNVLQISSGVAVVADGFWAAKKGRDALKIEWDEGANAKLSSAGITERLKALAEKPGADARKEGDAEKALAGAGKKIEAVYEVPFLAHATMEPMNCTAHVRKDACDIWVGTQGQTLAQRTAVGITGLPPEAINVHTTYLGGGFGRRFAADFVADAVETSKAVGAPVKVIWTREDDMQHGMYRPATYNRFAAALDKDGLPVAWSHRIVGPSIMMGLFPGAVKDGIDPTGVEGAANLPYGIANIHVEYTIADVGVPVWFWRSVGNSQNSFITESFIDELAVAGRKDPYEFRRGLLEKSPRHKAVLELAAAKAGWGKPLPKGHARGIAVAESFGSFVAEVAEVSLNEDGGVKVNRVVCAVDCGTVVNPDTVTAQMESAIVFGLTAALKGEITIENGRVQQGNFDNYPLLTMAETPAIEVHIVPSQETCGGIGEPGTPPIAPAVCNAVFALTGKRIRRLPIRIA